MNCPRNVLTRRSLTVVLTMFVGIGLATALLVFGQVNQALAQGITVDGNGSDWDPAWVVVVDPYDAISSSDPTTATRFASMHARSGYEVLSFSVHYDSDTWYFRLDTDGRPGDADSRTGTAADPGVGTTAFDSGPLSPVDINGVGGGEAYRIFFDYHMDNSVEEGPQLVGPPSKLPGVVYSTTNDLGTVVGNVAYSDSYTPTGIIEFGIPKSQFFPAGSCRSSLRAQAQAGSNYDTVSDDYVPSSVEFLNLLHFDLTQQVMTDTAPSNLVTYTMQYTITSDTTTIPAHNAFITQTLGADSYFDSCSGGAPCFHGGGTPGGMITWMLTSPITPGTASATGIVTAVIRTASLADQTAVVRLGADEGLCAESSTTFSPTLVSLSELRAQSVGLLNRFWWAALSLAGAAAALFAARRKARAV
jgi:hypothetical protein